MLEPAGEEDEAELLRHAENQSGNNSHPAAADACVYSAVIVQFTAASQAAL